MQRLYPDRRVVSINGDGDFLMNGQEFATAVHYGLPITVVVLDNGSLQAPSVCTRSGSFLGV